MELVNFGLDCVMCSPGYGIFGTRRKKKVVSLMARMVCTCTIGWSTAMLWEFSTALGVSRVQSGPHEQRREHVFALAKRSKGGVEEKTVVSHMGINLNLAIQLTAPLLHLFFFRPETASMRMRCKASPADAKL